MLDLASIKTLVGLFKDAIGIIEQIEGRKKDFLKEIFTPLYVRMESVANEYYGAIVDTRSALKVEDADIKAIIKDLEHRRSSLVLARDGVVGEARGLLRSFGSQGSHRPRPGRNISELASQFADSISSYFMFVHPLLESEGRSGGPGSASAMSGLIDDLNYLLIENRASTKEAHDTFREQLIQRIYWILDQLESSWRTIAVAYSELKVACHR